MAVQRQDGWATDARLSDIDLTGKEYFFCKATATGVTLAVANDPISGVISEGKAAGLHTSFNTAGWPLKVVAGGTITAGAQVSSDAQGRAVTGGTNPFGTARKSAAAGELVEVSVDRT